MITVDRFWQHEEGEFNSPDWRKEEWLIHCALIPVEQIDAAAIEIASPDYLTFETGWSSGDEFSFGDYSEYGNIELYSLVSAIKHPVSQELIVDLSREFIVYHSLEKRNQTQYFHPLDNIVVAEINIDSHSIYDPTPKVNVHRDYLRDFLAVMKMGLLISVVADRFANASTEEALELEVVEDSQIDQFTRLSTSIHTPEFTHHECFRGRSILRQNFIIAPYDKPKFERSPWYYFGKQVAEGSAMPSFIVNDEGRRQTLPQNTYLENYIQNGIGSFGYLWFRSEVLQKYLQVPGYSVSFHMRNWGVASVPGNRGTIDVGINSQGLINAFAPDIADLPFLEQSYWASYSSLPSGEICEEMFETRMQQNPPHSPGVVELIRDARTRLSSVFKDKFSVDLFKDMEPSQQELCRLSIGPILGQYTEVTELSKILYEWSIETMQITPLRKAVSALGGTVDEKLRQIKLLKVSLIAKGLDENKARSITAPLAGLYDLRIGAAHIGSFELEPIFQLMSASSTPKSPRAAWHLCVDSITLCLNTISATLET
ncbi:hypothetical protein [Dolichospermum flos-aquae]|uniref:Uncharacterized protein n=1 Tax=Dolichospermum flos-aquae CCAP 1403/13F TaxID=315271 RepID=A0A6H2C1F4_DOLFA|nr:hypothetical protein [Dolichospermum flos-aquae]QJB44779.1 hypothetical protein HGD76_11980 [Dolichospermum flos-aquae CCAP 1403/13F]